MWSRSFSIESLCVDALWQCVVLRVTCWFLSFCMSQSHPSILRAGLSPHASYQPDFDGHMLPLCLAGRSFEETQQKWQQWLGRHTHTQTPPDSNSPSKKKKITDMHLYDHTHTHKYKPLFRWLMFFMLSRWALDRRAHYEVSSSLKLVMELDHLWIMSDK